MRTILQCDRCDFHVTLPLDDPGTHRYYDLGEGHIAPLETEEAWCYNCQTMQVVEILPSRAFIDACINEFKESLADVDANADASRQQLPYVENMRRVVTSHDAWIAWVASRANPICLTCESDLIASSGVRHPDPPDNSWNWAPTSASAQEKPNALTKAFSHPGCGGMLSYKHTDIDIYFDSFGESFEFVRLSSNGFNIDGPDQPRTAVSP